MSRVFSSHIPHHGGFPLLAVKPVLGQSRSMCPSCWQPKHFISFSRFSLKQLPSKPTFSYLGSRTGACTRRTVGAGLLLPLPLPSGCYRFAIMFAMRLPWHLPWGAAALPATTGFPQGQIDVESAMLRETTGPSGFGQRRPDLTRSLPKTKASLYLPLSTGKSYGTCYAESYGTCYAGWLPQRRSAPLRPAFARRSDSSSISALER